MRLSIAVARLHGWRGFWGGESDLGSHGGALLALLPLAALDLILVLVLVLVLVLGLVIHSTLPGAAARLLGKAGQGDGVDCVLRIKALALNT